jgi:hypothetical protein
VEDTVMYEVAMLAAKCIIHQQAQAVPIRITLVRQFGWRLLTIAAQPVGEVLRTRLLIASDKLI